MKEGYFMRTVLSFLYQHIKILLVLLLILAVVIAYSIYARKEKGEISNFHTYTGEGLVLEKKEESKEIIIRALSSSWEGTPYAIEKGKEYKLDGKEVDQGDFHLIRGGDRVTFIYLPGDAVKNSTVVISAIRVIQP